ncbi:MAG TPA: 3-ketosteroid dehydrogenase, partial [Alphaproteobacteria bacterium]|nr:3-ketosteroid dehydrogenase [Alphaproteobacteria bacterium]
MVAILVDTVIEAEIEIDTLIIGGGAAGLTAALAACEAGSSVLIAERETVLSGSTALSSGLIPAAGTAIQSEQSIEDTADIFYSDIMAKNKNKADPDYVRRIVTQIPKTIDWLTAAHNIPFIVLDNFLYPSHTNHRMHAVPEVTGSGLIERLEAAVRAQDITIVTDLQITDLVVTAQGDALGAHCQRPDGSQESIAARSIILACNGYGGNPELVAQYIPEMHDALYFGHPGNQGEAVIWGQQLGAEIAHLSGYQGHGSVAHPHGILVTWALMMEGGIQVNRLGKRFSNEHQGYSEQAVSVLAQPDRIAFNIFDEQLCELGRGFEDFRVAEEAQAIIRADTPAELAEKLGINPD